MSVIIIILMAAGVFFFVVGVTGLIRLPDVFCRMHATTKCDTLGSGLILLGLVFYTGFSVAAMKLLLLIVLLWVANPTASHVIARAAYRNNDETAAGTFVMDLCEEVQTND